MRIISGKLGGRVIKTGDDGARPAMGKTREALFSMLEARGILWGNLRALDLFAGTGSLGFEAISRGAAHVDFVDNSPDLCKNMRQNAEKLGIEAQCGIFCGETRKFLSSRPVAPYGLVFIDPPYRKNLVGNTLQAIVANNFVVSGSIICAEVEKDAVFPVPDCLSALISRNYGQTTLNIWERE